MPNHPGVEMLELEESDGSSSKSVGRFAGGISWDDSCFGACKAPAVFLSFGEDSEWY